MQVSITKISSEYFTIMCPYDKYVVGKIKKLEGAKWDGEKWTVPRMSLSKTLIKGEMRAFNQLRLVLNGSLGSVNWQPEINYTDLTRGCKIDD